METTEALTQNTDMAAYQRAVTLPALTTLVITLVYFLWGLIADTSVFDAVGFTMSLLLGAWIGINILEEGGGLRDAIILPVIAGLVLGFLQLILIDLIVNESDFGPSLFEVISSMVEFGFGGLVIGRIYGVLFLEEAPKAE